ncbi:MAG: hypothetical protein RBQ88_03865 [Desulfobulbus oligotrophicus]|nr:hypothetical protein [Desulfobulbus oligotrophicus]
MDVLQRLDLPIKERMDAKKNTLAAEDAWNLLRTARQVLVARGKNFQVFDPQTDSKEDLLAKALGRTGNLRAPTIRINDEIWVGFSESLYARLPG